MLIVGLGNPGKRYEQTRHNIGYRIVQALAQKHSLKFKEEARFCGALAKGQIAGQELLLLLPNTYMNESGRAVRRTMDYYKLTVQQVVVVCDDIDLPFGKMRLRQKGGPGTHNGLKSIQQHMGNEYCRLRVGIADGRAEESLADYVLGCFSKEEEAKLPEIIAQAINALEIIIRLPIDAALKAINTAKSSQAVENEDIPESR